MPDRVRWLAGRLAPDAEHQVTVDHGRDLVFAHYDKEVAAVTWKTACGHHSPTAFVDDSPGRSRRANRRNPAHASLFLVTFAIDWEFTLLYSWLSGQR